MSFFARKIPAWAIVLSVLATAGLFTLAFMTLPSFSDAVQANRDFSVATAPSPLTVEQGSTVSSTVNMTSLNSYNLAIALTTALSPATSMLTVMLTPSVVTPTANVRASSTMTVVAQPGTAIGSYTVTLTATGGTKSHTATVTIIVVAVPDFSIAPSPASLTVFQNAANTTTLTLTSVGGFTGDVSLTLTAPFATIGVAGGGSPLRLTSGGTNTTTLAVYPSSQTTPGSYTISVTGTSGILLHTVNISIMVKASGCSCGIEALNLENYSFSNGTSTTLYIRNTGSASVSLVTYYVKDASGNTYSNTAWAGPTMSVNALGAVVIGIGASCPSCTLTGTPFTFTAGNSYTITVITSRNNQFIFTVIR